jgi:cytochrome c oxidase subunit 2
LLIPNQVTLNLNFLADSVAAAGTALLLGMAAMSPQQDPAAASAPFDSSANGFAVRTLAQGRPSLAQGRPSDAQGGPSDRQDEPRVIEVVAKRFTFEPARIEVAEGEHIRLVVTSADGVHGVGIKKFRVEKTVPRGGTPVTIDFVAASPGEFPILCSEYCGKGHDEMKGTLVVSARP